MVFLVVLKEVISYLQMGTYVTKGISDPKWVLKKEVIFKIPRYNFDLVLTF